MGQSCSREYDNCLRINPTQESHLDRWRLLLARRRIAIEDCMRVLIIDDSEILAQCLMLSLGEVAGLEVVGHAENVSDGIRKIRNSKPNAVVLDICMPDGTGMEVLESLKENPYPPIVIILSNYDYPQFRRKCLENGAHFYFDKSTEFHRVAEVLRNLMEVSAS